MDDKIILKLKNEGICYPSGLFTNDDVILSRILEVNKTHITCIKEQIISESSFQFNSAKTLLTRQEKKIFFTTGSETLDKVLQGGIPRRGIVEIVGESSTGKTQLCLQLSITSQIANHFKYPGVVYISTECRFPTGRLQEIITRLRERTTTEHDDFNDIRFSDNIFLKQIDTTENLLKCLREQVAPLVRAGRAHLVVVDSLAALFRADYDSNKHNSGCSVAICKLPVKPGNCKGSFPRFYYDETTNTCKSFIYGGCNGNGNSFLTLEICEKTCKKRCPEIKCEVPCQVYKLDKNGCKTCTCEVEFNPCSVVKCRAGFECTVVHPKCVLGKPCKPIAKCIAICKLPVKPGNCKGSFPRFYYDETTNTCKSFIYGGCNGNGNSFLTLENCEKTCKKRCPEIKCEVPCQVYKLDKNGCKTCTCEVEFNPCSVVKCKSGFECTVVENTCPKGEKCLPSAVCKSICTLPVKPGNCKGSFPRYYYDESTNTCKSFIYGGCNGNGNRFSTVEECKDSCADRCPRLECKVKCQFGYMFDDLGCRTCRCYPTPCASILCTEKLRCVAKPCKDYRCRSKGVCIPE